ncbi:MAG: FAD binding domain-containing protein [archaeon]|nr:FAD binding domain-containing protein [archaeon]
MSLAFRPKSFFKPSSEAELSKYLKQFGERAKIIAGGTGIYEIAHRGLLSDVEALVDISGLNLSYIESSSDVTRIGGATTMSALYQSKQIADRKELSAVLDSLKSIQPLQVKNVATIAGAICTALPFFDLPVALLSIGSRVRIGPTGAIKNLSDFVKGYFSVDLDQGEFVKEIEIPVGNKNTASAFQKFALTHDDWALINCGVSVSLDRGREISDSAIVFGGGVGEKAVRAKSIEKSLIGTRIDESKIKEIFDKEISKDLEPISDIRSSAKYRLHLAKVVGRRTFLEALGRIK